MMFEKNARKDHEVHFIVYANTKSLCCIPKANIMLCISDILIFLKKGCKLFGLCLWLQDCISVVPLSL